MVMMMMTMIDWRPRLETPMEATVEATKGGHVGLKTMNTETHPVVTLEEMTGNTRRGTKGAGRGTVETGIPQSPHGTDTGPIESSHHRIPYRGPSWITDRFPAG